MILSGPMIIPIQIDRSDMPGIGSPRSSGSSLRRILQIRSETNEVGIECMCNYTWMHSSLSTITIIHCIYEG